MISRAGSSPVVCSNADLVELADTPESLSVLCFFLSICHLWTERPAVNQAGAGSSPAMASKSACSSFLSPLRRDPPCTV